MVFAVAGLNSKAPFRGDRQRRVDGGRGAVGHVDRAGWGAPAGGLPFGLPLEKYRLLAVPRKPFYHGVAASCDEDHWYRRRGDELN